MNTANRAANDSSRPANSNASLANRGRGIAYAAKLTANTDEYMSERIGYAEFTKRNGRIWREIEAAGVTREVSAVLRSR